MFVDTHAHLDFPEFNRELTLFLDRAEQSGVHEIITIGIDIPSSGRAIELGHSHSNIWSTVGIHPHGARELDEDTLAVLSQLAAQQKVVAIGEIGLDYYRDRQPRPIQQRCLRQQIELACEVNLPVVFHIREAYEDFLCIIRDYVSSLTGGVLHWFSGDWEVARKCLDLGFFLSIPGTVTFSKADMVQEVVRRAPLERLLLETDAPFLAPMPYRGKVNEPSYLIHTARKIAELRGCELEEIGMQTTTNARLIFGMKQGC
jgi:TatD DNase family protein